MMKPFLYTSHTHTGRRKISKAEEARVISVETNTLKLTTCHVFIWILSSCAVRLTANKGRYHAVLAGAAEKAPGSQKEPRVLGGGTQTLERGRINTESNNL